MQRRRRSNNASLQAQVQQLAQAVANLQMPRQRSRGRSRSRSRAATAVVQAPAATSRSVTRGRSPAPRRALRDNNFSQTGTIRFTNRELFTSLHVPANTAEYGGMILINANESTNFLSKLGALFGRMRWLSMSFEYESMVSSATDGVIAYGLDWSCESKASSKDATTFAKVTALNPSVSHPLWESNVRLPRPPPGRLNARVWYDIGSATGEISSVASLAYYITAKVESSQKSYGALWISYTVEFQGPHL